MYRQTLLCISAFVLLCTSACKSEGTIQGDLTEPTAPSTTEPESTPESTPEQEAAPPPKHERVSFTWESEPGVPAGTIDTTLPDGEAFTGHYHEIMSTTEVSALDGFYELWYGGVWAEPRWVWGGDWPYYESDTEFITYYTGRVMAILDGDKGTSMRCNFQLDEPSRGMKGGGSGDCQLSNGDRITAIFPAT